MTGLENDSFLTGKATNPRTQGSGTIVVTLRFRNDPMIGTSPLEPATIDEWESDR